MDPSISRNYVTQVHLGPFSQSSACSSVEVGFIYGVGRSQSQDPEESITGVQLSTGFVQYQHISIPALSNIIATHSQRQLLGTSCVLLKLNEMPSKYKIHARFQRKYQNTHTYKHIQRLKILIIYCNNNFLDMLGRVANLLWLAKDILDVSPEIKACFPGNSSVLGKPGQLVTLILVNVY